MITQEQIDEAEAAVEEYERKLDAAEDYHARAGGKVAIAELVVARADAGAARSTARRLRAQFAAEQAIRARRTAAEGAFAADRDKVAAELTAGRDEAARAVAALDRAAGEALRVVAEYSRLVRSTAEGMQAAGLRHDDGGVEGGSADGSVHVGGEVWRPASGPDVLASLVSSVVAVHDQRHPLATKWRFSGGLLAQAGQAELLKAVAR
ncbi:hypothetical protein [Streptomyces ossamyceticus]|uniref:hypothetical protein n=1 Tax=Streptomyces ossamyceticus TaxID=249581 RepID=UPI003446E2E8